MGIDPNLLLQIRPPQVESPVNALAQVMPLVAMQRQNQLGQMQLDETAAKNARMNALRAYLLGKDLNTQDAQADLARRFPMEAGAVLEPVLKAAETRAKIGQHDAAAKKDTADTTAKALAYSREMLPLVQTPEHMATWMRGLYVNPVTRDAIQGQFGTYEDAVQRIPSEPAKFKDFLQLNAMGMDKYIADQTSRSNNATTNATHVQTANIAASTQRRGQDMTDARSRDSNHAAMTKPFEVTGADGNPVLVQQAKDGTIKPVDGYTPRGSTGKPLPNAVVKQITEARDNATTIDRLATGFKPEYAGKGVLGVGGDMQLAVSGNLGKDKEAVEWWKNYRKQAELVERHALFGAALTPTEQASWRSADIGPGMDAGVIATNLATRTSLAKKVLENTRQDLIDAGHSEKRVGAIADRNNAPAAASVPTAPKKIASDADFAALPSGAEFIAPDGSHRRKP